MPRRYSTFAGGPGPHEEATSLKKMAREPADRKIRRLTSVFPYHGDKLRWSTDENITAGVAIERMEIAQMGTGYRLQWRVRWEDEAQ